MLYDVSHRSTFTYAAPVALSHHHLHLRPRDTPLQRVRASRLNIRPMPVVASDHQDFFGNRVTDVTVQESHQRLLVEARAQVAVEAPPARDLAASPSWESVAAELTGVSSPVARDAQQFTFASPHVALSQAVLDLASSVFTPGRPFLLCLAELTSRIYHDFTYRGGVTDIYTPVEEVIDRQEGVCQDFAHVGLACLRVLGLAARYVSGYLLTHPPEGQPRRIGADASHAWISAWCPQFGWVDADPTNDLLVGDEHITLAWGRDYGDVSPINGSVVGGGAHKVHVAVDVVPLETVPA
ncbi:MAG: transglutaminase family protein [Pseudomonadota bacterium]